MSDQEQIDRATMAYLRRSDRNNLTHALTGAITQYATHGSARTTAQNTCGAEVHTSGLTRTSQNQQANQGAES